LPEGNTITRGSWFSPAEGRAGQWSVEEGLAETLGIELGDVLTFRIAAEEVSGAVTSLRRVVWDSFQVNFFVIASPGLLVDRPTTYIGSFALHPARGAVLAGLIRQFPGVTVFDVGMLLEQVQDIIDQVSLVVQYVFVFTLLAGITVLIAAVQVGAHDRLTEMAILRALGAGRRRLEWGLLLEFLILGSIAGLLAALFSVLAGHILAREVFDLPFEPGIAVWLVGIGGGALGIGLVGLVASRSVLRNPPLTRLQWIQS
ncbi:MAG: FtsX-like permease family protein, partial [Arenicellales bacterium]|nr:FtsX-like permease family protein [Arenicellales bacterium]